MLYSTFKLTKAAISKTFLNFPKVWPIFWGGGGGGGGRGAVGGILFGTNIDFFESRGQSYFYLHWPFKVSF